MGSAKKVAQIPCGYETDGFSDEKVERKCDCHYESIRNDHGRIALGGPLAKLWEPVSQNGN